MFTLPRAYCVALHLTILINKQVPCSTPTTKDSTVACGVKYLGRSVGPTPTPFTCIVSISILFYYNLPSYHYYSINELNIFFERYRYVLTNNSVGYFEIENLFQISPLSKTFHKQNNLKENIISKIKLIGKF